jgi:quinol monooxygenase YgiN
MWAQLIKLRAKPGRESEIGALFETLHAAEQPNSGLVRTVAMVDQKDPSVAYTFVLFESEEKARARECDPRRNELLATVRAQMGDIFEMPPEFVDLAVLHDEGPK